MRTAVAALLLLARGGAGALQPLTPLSVAAGRWRYQAAAWGGTGSYVCEGEAAGESVFVHSCASGAAGVAYVDSQTWGLFAHFGAVATPAEVRRLTLTVPIAATTQNSYGSPPPAEMHTEIRADVFSAAQQSPSTPFHFNATWPPVPGGGNITPPEGTQRRVQRECGFVNFGYEGPLGPRCSGPNGSTVPCSPGDSVFAAPLTGASANVTLTSQTVSIELGPAGSDLWWARPFVVRLTSPDSCYQTHGGMAPTACSNTPGGEYPRTQGSCGWGDVTRGPFCPNATSKGCSPYVPRDLAHVSVNVSSAVRLAPE